MEERWHARSRWPEPSTGPVTSTAGRNHKNRLRHCKKLPPLACPFMHPNARYPPHIFLAVDYAAWHRTAKPSLPTLSHKSHHSCGVSRSCLVPHCLLARRRTATRQRHPPCRSIQVSESSADDAQYLLRYVVKGNYR